MSRIHEALKKVERTRALNDAPHNDAPRPPVGDGQPPRAAQPISIPVSMAATPRVPEIITASNAVDPVSSASASPPEANALLQNCARSDWKPAPEMLFLGNHAQATGNEEFRTLRSRLYQMREQRQLRKLLITSPLPNEGKSFVAANVAQVIACQEGQRVLLIDADLRDGSLHKLLGTSSKPGFSDYLLGGMDELVVIQRGPAENLFFIPAGQAVPNPAELVANGHLKTLLDRCESLFEWIIIDSPPAIPVSDATLLADCCDGVLMVVRSNVTDSDAARKAWMEFRETQVVGVVLNGVKASSLQYYSSYGRT